jgi:L-lysine 2,3-aminomutase
MPRSIEERGEPMSEKLAHILNELNIIDYYGFHLSEMVEVAHLCGVSQLSAEEPQEVATALAGYARKRNLAEQTA